MFIKPKWGVAVSATRLYSQWMDNALVDPSINTFGHYDQVRLLLCNALSNRYRITPITYLISLPLSPNICPIHKMGYRAAISDDPLRNLGDAAPDTKTTGGRWATFLGWPLLAMAIAFIAGYFVAAARLAGNPGRRLGGVRCFL